MDFDSFFNSRLFHGITVLANMLFMNILFIITVGLTTGILLVPSFIALLGVMIEIRENRDNDLFRKYFLFLKRNVLFGFQLTVVIIPVGVIAYLNYRFVRVFYEETGNTWMSMLSLSVFTFILFLFCLTMIQMMLWRLHHHPSRFREAFNHGFAMAMSGFKELVMMILLLVISILLGYIFPFLILVILCSVFAMLVVLIYDRKYKRIDAIVKARDNK